MNCEVSPAARHSDSCCFRCVTKSFALLYKECFFTFMFMVFSFNFFVAKLSHYNN